MLATSTKPRKPVMRKCASCGNPFQKMRMGQRACGPDCAVALVRKEAASADRKLTKTKLEALKPRSKWLAEAQAVFNAWVRERDADLPCISCGRYHQGAHDAGHYRSVGSMPALRFHEDNCHKQCVPCNQHKGGNIVEYRLRLFGRIGPERLAFLEGPHEPAKFTIEDAKRIKAEYKLKLAELKKRQR